MYQSLFFDIIAWLMTVTAGLIFLTVSTWRGSDVRSHFFECVHAFFTRGSARNIPELRKRISTASDLRSTMATLPYWAQLEMAENLINEGPPYAVIALDAVFRIARSSTEDGRDKALGFLTSSSIPCAARVSLAQRLLASKADDVAKIAALRALCELATDVTVHQSGLIDSIVFLAAEGISDRSPKVRAFAVDALERDLRNFVPTIDGNLARRLSHTEGDSRAELLRFIERNESLVPHAALRARMYGTDTLAR